MSSLDSLDSRLRALEGAFLERGVLEDQIAALQAAMGKGAFFNDDIEEPVLFAATGATTYSISTATTLLSLVDLTPHIELLQGAFYTDFINDRVFIGNAAVVAPDRGIAGIFRLSLTVEATIEWSGSGTSTNYAKAWIHQGGVKYCEWEFGGSDEGISTSTRKRTIRNTINELVFVDTTVGPKAFDAQTEIRIGSSGQVDIQVHDFSIELVALADSATP